MKKLCGTSRVLVVWISIANPKCRGKHIHIHTDLAVVGAGPAGIAAAREAARLGVDVVLIDDQPEAGGHLQWQLLSDHETSPGELPGYELARALEKQLQGEPNIRRFKEATAFGLYEGGLLGVVQGERLIKVRARRVVVATGGFETPLVFHNNDLPGVFLGEGLQRLTTIYGIRPGQRALVVTDSDRGARLARELLAVGIEVAAIADARPDPPRSFHREQLGEAVSVWAGHTVLESRGKRHVQGAGCRSVGFGWHAMRGLRVVRRLRPSCCGDGLATRQWTSGAGRWPSRVSR